MSQMFGLQNNWRHSPGLAKGPNVSYKSYDLCTKCSKHGRFGYKHMDHAAVVVRTINALMTKGLRERNGVGVQLHVYLNSQPAKVEEEV